MLKITESAVKSITITSDHGQSIEVAVDDSGVVTLRAANYRFLAIADGGGHLEIHALGSLPPTGTGLEIDQVTNPGFPLIHYA